MERLSKIDKGLMDMDNSWMIMGGYKSTKWQWKKYNKNKLIFEKSTANQPYRDFSYILQIQAEIYYRICSVFVYS